MKEEIFKRTSAEDIRMMGNSLENVKISGMSDLEEKYDLLKSHIGAYAAKGSIIVAFSGGVDSALLVKLACEAAKESSNASPVYAVTVRTKLHPAGDLETAARLADEMGAIHKILQIDELSETGIENNPVNRCYLCKKGIFQKIIELAQKLGAGFVLEGTNADDLHEYRPGLKALKELGIISPLAACGLTKAEIRQLAEQLGISVANRPSSPCLATRLPYGTAISYGLLQRIDEGENYLRGLGFYNVRLRVYDAAGGLVRIEVDVEDLPKVISYRKEIAERIKKLGFTYVTLDLEGFRSGSMDAGKI